jgi:hypothetical protein
MLNISTVNYSILSLALGEKTPVTVGKGENRPEGIQAK